MDETLITIVLIDDTGSQPEVLIVRNMVNVLANQLSVNHPLLRVGNESLNVRQDVIQTTKLFPLSTDELLLKVGATNPIELLAEAEPLVFVHLQLSDLIRLLHFPLRDKLKAKRIIHGLNIASNADALGDDADVERPQLILRTLQECLNICQNIIRGCVVLPDVGHQLVE